MSRPRVLFLCTHNSARSQMAEGFLRAMAGDRFEAGSAGTEKTSVNPLAIRVMAELGIDLGGHTLEGVRRTWRRAAWDYLITVCDDANERCPWVPGSVQRLHWSFPDPSRATGNRGGAARRLPPGARPDPGAPDRLAPRPVTPARLVACVCVAQVCAQIGAYTWPALLPGFLAEWQLTNREAGWITGIFYAAYTVSVPVLVTLTDRVDARAVYLSGVALTVASHLGFAAFVDGPWGAAAARALAGIGWAGTYMTGLKLLADRVEPVLMSRAVAGPRREHRHRGRDLVRVRGHDRPMARLARRLRGGRGRRDRRAG